VRFFSSSDAGMRGTLGSGFGCLAAATCGAAAAAFLCELALIDARGGGGYAFCCRGAQQPSAPAPAPRATAPPAPIATAPPAPQHFPPPPPPPPPPQPQRPRAGDIQHAALHSYESCDAVGFAARR
jgi:hypothetical protein